MVQRVVLAGTGIALWRALLVSSAALSLEVFDARLDRLLRSLLQV